MDEKQACPFRTESRSVFGRPQLGWLIEMPDRGEQEELAMAVIYLAKAVKCLAEEQDDVRALDFAAKAKRAAVKTLPSQPLAEDERPPRSTID